jgi:hypothetical protein
MRECQWSARIFALVVAPEHLANRFKDATLPAVLATDQSWPWKMRH